MNVGTRAISFVAAAGLALCLTGGVVAQGIPDDEGTTKLELLGGTCTGAIDKAEVDFGTYTFDGANFVPDGTSGTATLSLTVDDNTTNKQGCDMELVASLLEAEGVTPSISVFLSTDTIAQASTITISATEGSPVSIDASINPTLSNAMVPAVYTGTITVTNVASNG